MRLCRQRTLWSRLRRGRQQGGDEGPACSGVEGLRGAPLVAPACEIVEKTFGNWSYTSLSFGQTASTQSAQDTKGMSLGAGYEEGVFTITVMNVALMMTGQQGYKTEVSYDGQTWETVENDSQPVENLPKLLIPALGEAVRAPAHQ